MFIYGKYADIGYTVMYRKDRDGAQPEDGEYYAGVWHGRSYRGSVLTFEGDAVRVLSDGVERVVLFTDVILTEV